MLRNCIASRRPATFAWDLVAVSEMAHSMLMQVPGRPPGWRNVVEKGASLGPALSRQT